MNTKNFKYIQWSYVKKDLNHGTSLNNGFGPKKQNLLSLDKQVIKWDLNQAQQIYAGYIGSSGLPLEEQKYSQSKNTKSKNTKSKNNITRFDWVMTKDK